MRSALAILFLAISFAASAAAQVKPVRDYLVYVLSESGDKIALVRFGPDGARIDRQIATGEMPVDIDGPHGIVVSPDRQFYYVTFAHGRPFGSVWKYATKDDSLIGKTTLGHFPASLDITPDGAFLYVVNFNLHGDMVPSSVSVVSTETMAEVARLKTCTMPHGSRLNSQGTKQYSACMMDNMLVEIDTRTLKVTQQFALTKAGESGSGTKHSGGHGMETPRPGDKSCSPTWAEPSIDGASVFVACNNSSEIVEVNTRDWRIVRRLAARAGVYNLDVSHDGQRLVATNKRDQSVSIYELKSGRELARLTTKRKVLHGVVISPDDRYAFVSVEGIGSEPGTVEVIDLTVLKTVATIDVAPTAAGIDFYKTQPLKNPDRLLKNAPGARYFSLRQLGGLCVSAVSLFGEHFHRRDAEPAGLAERRMSFLKTKLLFQQNARLLFAAPLKLELGGVLGAGSGGRSFVDLFSEPHYPQS